MDENIMKKMLVIGASGTGKTVAVTKLANDTGKKTYILNGAPNVKHPFPTVTWGEEVLKLRDCNIITEGRTNYYFFFKLRFKHTIPQIWSM